MKKKASLFLSGIFAVALLSFMPFKPYQENWKVPDAQKNKVNPMKDDGGSLATGKTLYNQHCKSCHGTKGKGDGPKASQLDTECGDFTSAEFKKQTDGSLFYKTYEGRKDMPSFKKKIPDADDIWAVVNYMRSLK